MIHFDIAIVGAGIVGLAHAMAARDRGLRVVVVDRDARASDASVRNFGFVTVSGQANGLTRERSLRSRDTWLQVAAQARIPIHQRGAIVVAHRPEAFDVLGQFHAGDMGEGCELWDAARTARELPMLGAAVEGALWSSHEARVEAREALPRLAAWLQSRGVEFHWGCEAFEFDGGRLRHSGGSIEAHAAVFAPGNAVRSLFPLAARREEVRICKLQMMRLAAPDWRLPAVVMSDLSLVRYEGFATQPGATALRKRLEREAGEALARGIHLIVAQGGDGSLVVGDSHDYGDTADALSDSTTDDLILGEMNALFSLSNMNVAQRWNGYYPVARTQPLLREKLGERSRLVVVTSGTGMSTAFAIGEETVAELFG